MSNHKKDAPDPSVFECEHCQEVLELERQSEIEFVCDDCHENPLRSVL